MELRVQGSELRSAFRLGIPTLASPVATTSSSSSAMKAMQKIASAKTDLGYLAEIDEHVGRDFGLVRRDR
eukprot:670699-Rhodomonas_salina.2